MKYQKLDEIGKQLKSEDIWKFQLTHCTNENEDVMKRFYGIHANGCKPHIIERMVLDRIIAKYGDNGYACLSASRGDKTDKENEDATRQLLSDIRAGHWSFLPTYSRFKNIETGEVDGYNPSFIVFNQSKQGDVRDYNDLFDFAKRMCGKYNHDVVVVKAPDKSSIYIDCNGEPCDKTEDTKAWKNGILFEKNIYVNPIPCTLGERIHRSGMGEVMLF